MERRIVAQLLTSLDDLNHADTNGKSIIIIGATNRPGMPCHAMLCRENGLFIAYSESRFSLFLGEVGQHSANELMFDLDALDQALRRSGRFDREIALPVPDLNV